MPTPSCSSWLRLSAAMLGLLLGTSAAAAAMCDVPSFSNVGGPLPLGEGDVDAYAVVAGNFVSRSGERCDCDIATVTVDAEASRLQILRGRDDGSFEPAQQIELPGLPVAAVKFGGSEDRDGVAVLQRMPDGIGLVSFYVVDAGGQPAETGTRRQLGSAPTALASSDFNGDGNTDLIIGAAQEPRLTLLMGAAGGDFQDFGDTLPAVLVETAEDHFVTGFAVGSYDDAKLAVADRSASGGQFVGFVGIDESEELVLRDLLPLGPGDGVAIANVRFDSETDMLMAVAADAGATTTGRLLRLQQLNIHDMGLSFDRPPRSIVPADLNGDAFLDLVISTYGGEAASPDARIHLLRGNDRGDFIPMLMTPPRDLRAAGLVVGTFGRDVASQGRRHAGIAAIEDPPGDAVVYRGDGAGAFLRPTGFRTDLPQPGARVVVSDDLHGDDGQSLVADLGYTWFDTDRGRFMFSVMISNGNRSFTDSGQAVSVGKEPLLFATGRFDDDLITDLAVVDGNPDDVQNRPLLKLFRGLGGGQFAVVSGISEYPLGANEEPRGMIAGKLAVGDGPMDITVVSANPVGGALLTRFRNDGTGGFEPDEPLSVALAAGAVFASNKFRGGGLLDFVIRGNHDNSFMFLRNDGRGDFISHELIRDPNGTGLLAGGPPPGARRLFVVDINGDNFDDLVGIDEDLRIDSFIGDGDGGFRFTTSDALRFLQPMFILDTQFFVDDFGGGRAGLVALMRRGFAPAMVSLGTDASGQFLPNPEIVLLEPPVADSQNPVTLFDRHDITNPGEITIAPLDQVFTGRFANLAHGSGLPDIGAVITAGRIEVLEGQCPNDPQPHPGDEEVCVTTETPPEPNALCMRQCPHSECTGVCNPTTHMCRTDCGITIETECRLEPRHAYCNKTTEPLTYLMVFGNTCPG